MEIPRTNPIQGNRLRGGRPWGKSLVHAKKHIVQVCWGKVESRVRVNSKTVFLWGKKKTYWEAKRLGSFFKYETEKRRKRTRGDSRRGTRFMKRGKLGEKPRIWQRSHKGAWGFCY